MQYKLQHPILMKTNVIICPEYLIWIGVVKETYGMMRQVIQILERYKL